MSSSSANLHVVVGLGVTGLSCARYLSQQGIACAVTDASEHPSGLEGLRQSCPDMPVSLGKLDTQLLSQAAKIVLSPGIALSEPVIAAQIKKGTPVVGDIELFAQATQAPVIAVTGTNAKSTVTSLVGKMVAAAGLRTHVGGNLGVPALDLLAGSTASDVFVLELSSFQLETTYSLTPTVATILNITPDHMDRYHDVQAYQQAKHKIYQHCRVAVCNRDDVRTDCDLPSLEKKFYFTLQSPRANEFGLLRVGEDFFLSYGETPLLSVQELPVLGKHYQANALAALALGHGFGLPWEPMLQVLREFQGLPHRCQLVRKRKQVNWYNDSKGTNVGATIAAIEGLAGAEGSKIILIAGGLGKNADFSPLLAVIEKYVRAVVLIGEAAPLLANLINNRVDTYFATTMADAVDQADQVAQAGDIVLLSPACASWDMFKHYAHRGEVFTECVDRLP